MFVSYIAVFVLIFSSFGSLVRAQESTSPTPEILEKTQSVSIQVPQSQQHQASADIDQCANGGVGKTPEICTGANWVNGNLGESKAHYLEGDFVPYRIKMDDVSIGDPHTITIEWDTTKNGKHAVDYIGTYKETETDADPCSGVTGCGGTFDTAPIPLDAKVLAGQDETAGNGDDIVQIPGELTLFGGNITAVSGYTISGSYAGDSSTSIVIEFTSTVDNPVLAWSGHIATRDDWGLTNSAISITGSPYHMRLLDIDGKGGNQDRSLSAEAIIFPASITIVKDAVPNHSQDFAFNTTDGFGSFSLDDDNDGTLSNTKIFSDIATFGEMTITEEITPGWTLTNLTCSVQGTGSQSTDILSRTATLDVEEGDVFTCTFTNTLQQAHLTLIKEVTNDDGGTALPSAWTLSAQGATPISGVSGSGAVTNAAVDAGEYTLSESGGPSGYTGGTYSCVKNSGAPVVSNSITLEPDDTAVCTVTNNDIQPKLIVTKIVVNDNSGTKDVSDFPLFVDTTGVTSGDENGFDAGSYVVSETEDSGYTSVISGDCDVDGNVVLGVGDEKECIITNDDKPATLIVEKVVVNDNGGKLEVDDFTFKINEGDAVPFETDGSNSMIVDAGMYDVVEPAVDGYETTYDNCEDIDIPNGGSATCTITNDDIAPVLHLRKEVINDNGGTAVETDWTLTADGSETDLSGQSPVDSDSEFMAGTYTLGEEDGPQGYSASQYVCVKNDDSGVPGNSITLGIGDEATCTITNDDQAPSLTLQKTVINNHGGTAVASAWNLNADGPTGFSGAGPSVANGNSFDAGTYSLSETGGVAGYAPSTWVCTGGTQNGSDITLGLGQSATCTITNDDIAPTLTVIKELVPSTDTGKFNLQIDGVTQGTGGNVGDGGSTGSIALVAGTYTVSETAVAGSDLSHYTRQIGGDCAVDGTVTLTLGQNKTCTITNTRKGHIIVDKVTLPSGEAQSFFFDVSGSNYTDFSIKDEDAPNDQEVPAGMYSIVETAVQGWDSDGGVCDNGESPDSLEVEPGETVTCTFTNSRRGSITIIKDAIENDAQDFNFTGNGGIGSFSLDDDEGVQGIVDAGVLSNSASFTNLQANEAYTILETQANAFWQLQGVSCIDGEDNPYQVTSVDNGVVINLHPGTSVICTFTNRKLGPTRTQGFWQTHTAYTNSVFGSHFGGGMQVGVSGIHSRLITNITNPGSSILYGAYYSSIPKTTQNKNRTSIDKARMQLLQQLVTAKLNCAAFGCPIIVQDMIDDADAAYANGPAALILVYAGGLDAYNNSGDTIIMSGNPGKATPKTSQSLADKLFWNQP